MNRAVFYSLLESGYELRDSSRLMEDGMPGGQTGPAVGGKPARVAYRRDLQNTFKSRAKRTFGKAKYAVKGFVKRNPKAAGAIAGAAGLAGVAGVARKLRGGAKPSRMAQLKNILRAHGGKAAAGAAAGAVGLHLLRRRNKK